MILFKSMTSEAHWDHITQWHKWFAWRPVFADIDQKNACWVWLQTIERKVIWRMEDIYCVYRIPSHNNEQDCTIYRIK